MPGRPRQMRGLLEVGGARFDFRARAYARGPETIILSSGIDARASEPMKKYAEQIHTAIRREFKVRAR